MNILDIILLVCFIPALIQGVRKGFISQVIAIISLILGIWMSARFSSMASEWLGQYIEGSEQVLKIVAFALILIGVILVLTLVGRLIEQLFKFVMLGWLNKLLGVAFALLKTGLIVGLIIMAFCSLNETFDFVKEETLNESVLFPVLRDMANKVFPYIKEMFTYTAA